ncbi:hypothetical protein [Mesoflavibacter sp. CH_XMU1422-2]|uniref:hypothetical protein n=1 Tax=Mesoflavibacter sp. CH_XMU1422-2 TaxID=3107770 RepID=UPI0030080731
MIYTFWSSSNYNLPNLIKQELIKYSYVFNPSYVKYNHIHYLAIRVYCKKKKAVLSLLYIWDRVDSFETFDLSKYFKNKINLNKVADPKLFIMNKSVWCTFNSGYVEKGNNNIVLFKLNKNCISDYYNCFFSERNKIEKNWAFFYKDDSIHVLYDLNSLTILKEESKNDNKLIFREYVKKNNFNRSYSIGTPLVVLKENVYGFIGHKKINRKNKRLYLGSFFKLNTETMICEKKQGLYIHSLKSLLGVKFKFNKNLISCTYFSGLYKLDKDYVIIGYGINDVDWRLKKIKINKLWR